MNIFFDVDYTILGVDRTLRPGTREVFERLVGDGHRVHVWSGMGRRWEVVRGHRLEPFVSGVYEKPVEDHWAGLIKLGVDVVPDYVIDDHREVVDAFGGYLIPRFYYGRGEYATPDDELERVYDAICAWPHTEPVARR